MLDASAVDYLFDVCSDVFLDVVLLQGLCGTLHSVLLHVLRHVGIFYHCLSVRHGCPGKPKHRGDSSSSVDPFHTLQYNQSSTDWNSDGNVTLWTTLKANKEKRISDELIIT